MNTTLNALSAQMDSIVNTFGEDACFSHADRVYSKMFRTEAVELHVILNANCSSQDAYYEMYHEVIDGIIEADFMSAYCKATGRKSPQQAIAEINNQECKDWENEDSYDHAKEAHFDSLYDHFESWKDSQQPHILESGHNESLMVCTLCNYKGEMEDIVAFESVKHLPVFVSKRESFNI